MFRPKPTPPTPAPPSTELTNAEMDKLRETLGVYINVDAFSNCKLFSVERVCINNPDEKDDAERTWFTFVKSDNAIVEQELVCSRKDHIDIVNKLNKY